MTLVKRLYEDFEEVQLHDGVELRGTELRPWYELHMTLTFLRQIQNLYRVEAPPLRQHEPDPACVKPPAPTKAVPLPFEGRKLKTFTLDIVFPGAGYRSLALINGEIVTQHGATSNCD